MSNTSLSCLLSVTLLIVSASANAAEYSECGNPFVNHFGPWDYRTASQENKDVVEKFHFTPETEQLKVPSGTGYPGGDISYTLHVFPNHPRALLAMSKLAVQQKTSKPRYAKFSIDCYFDRAMRFRPDDGQVYLIYGMHLLAIGQMQNAISQLERAAALNEGNANVHYNLGLAYFDAKDYSKSLAHAHRAYALGFPLPGLRIKLERMGKWEPPPSESATTPSQ